VQRERLVRDPSKIPVAVEEMLRWVSPIKNMNRTATRDTTLRGQKIREGDKRILLIDGKPVPHCLARIPKAGESRGNLAAGGLGVAQPLSEADKSIAAAIGPTLRARGLPLALVTNGDAGQQRDKIERHDLARYFGAILIEGEFGCGKPEERVYREALHQLGVGPGDAWMVGDHLEWDVLAPQRLGLTGVWIDREGAGLPAQADARPHRIIRSLSELLE